ncbi:hypothetical protein [Planktothrix sp. FACHB-1365]|uniref:Cas10/Cmr2 second palm domain-containing protein n=1 Tax=Planktothrix sp. FACHB-1365 TaxID=2692855 RepID=UPI001685BE65|nr:hypothetical protein [Planktothrix sp. FACHB-1365]MBD2483315.1 hypothetical protein [Planktothrix sp. FACHB-1365]
MSEYTATIIDTTGIQPYIFGSNRLRENIGASYLIAEATKQWVEQALIKLGKPFYFPDPELSEQRQEPHPEPDAKPYIEEGNLASEVIYAGGGNAVLLFASHDDAVDFTKILSSRILKKAPGLNLVVAHKRFDFDDQERPLRQVIDDLMKDELESKKRQRIPSVPLLGLGVTADCNSTRLVAIGTSDQFKSPNKYLVSREVKYKLIAVFPARTKLGNFFKNDIDFNVYDFPLEFDNLGRTQDESSYIAVIHADGNSMGDRFQKQGETASTNREYITRMRQLSWSVNQIGKEALRTVVKTLVNSIHHNSKGAFIKWFDSENQLISQIELKKNPKNGKFFLPFRPLVYGGDDVTFICDGRLGLTLAALFLKEFEKTAADGEILTACAGISIIKSHYPFARAYELSESLCGSAKKMVREGGGGFSALDWHIAASGLIGSLGDIRKREYQVNNSKKEKNLSMRPIRLKAKNGEWQNWNDFESVVTELNDWRDKRNKVIALREVLRKGSDATQQFLHLYRMKELPCFSQAPNDDLKNTGWIDDYSGSSGEKVCGHFDAIEAMEFYFPLSGVNDE